MLQIQRTVVRVRDERDWGETARQQQRRRFKMTKERDEKQDLEDDTGSLSGILTGLMTSDLSLGGTMHKVMMIIKRDI